MGLALVTRIPTLVEAQIAAGALRSAGIRAEVFDGNFGQMEAPVIEGLGGYRIMAPADQASDARQVLKLLRASPGLGESEDVAPWSAALARRARSRKHPMRWLALLLLGVPTLYWLARLALG
jgi:hypothetical protein